MIAISSQSGHERNDMNKDLLINPQPETQACDLTHRVEHYMLEKTMNTFFLGSFIIREAAQTFLNLASLLML